MNNEKTVKNKPVKQIDNMRIESCLNNDAPGNKYFMTGNALNDDRFPDGSFIRTSRLVHIDFVQRIAETRNTRYKF